MRDDLTAIRSVEAAYDSAWRDGDLDALCSCFVEDAVIVNPRGQVAAGIEQIRRELASVLNGPASDSTHMSELTRIAFVTEDVAIVDGEATIEAIDGRRPSMRHSFTDVLVRRGDRWLIAHVRAYGLADL